MTRKEMLALAISRAHELVNDNAALNDSQYRSLQLFGEKAVDLLAKDILKEAVESIE